ncbi:MAG: AAA family ATPase, partial [Solirubrobacteraceae bacterium]
LVEWDEMGRDAGSKKKDRDDQRTVVLTKASSMQLQKVEWLWQDRLPLADLAVLAGEAGLGKSTTTTELAARVSRGDLDGALFGQPRDVLVCTAEDHFESVVLGRLMAADADLRRIHQVTISTSSGADLLEIPDDLDAIDQACRSMTANAHPPALLIVDPIAAFLGGGVDTHRDAAVRRVLAPLAALAQSRKLSVLAVCHLNKSNASKLLDRVGGSVAFGAAPRSVLAFARHPTDPEGEQGAMRVIVHAKSNHGKYAQTEACHIAGVEIDGVGSVSRVVFDGPCDVSPADLAPQDKYATDDDERRGAKAEAVAFLLEELADGARLATEVQAAAKDAGISVATLRRARAKLSIKTHKTSQTGPWEWALPSFGPRCSSDDEHLGNDEGEHLGESPVFTGDLEPSLFQGAQHSGVEHLEHLGASGESSSDVVEDPVAEWREAVKATRRAEGHETKWSFSRLVEPSPGSKRKRRVRQEVEVTFCAEGFWEAPKESRQDVWRVFIEEGRYSGFEWHPELPDDLRECPELPADLREHVEAREVDR